SSLRTRDRTHLDGSAHDRLRKLESAAGAGVGDGEQPASRRPNQPVDRLGEVTRAGRTPHLVRDDLQRSPLFRALQDRLDEVLAMDSVQPRGSYYAGGR